MDAYVYVIDEANIEEMEELMRKPKGVFLSETIDAYFHERITVPAVANAIVLGEARGRIEILLHVLQKKFRKVPQETEDHISSDDRSCCARLRDSSRCHVFVNERIYRSDEMTEFSLRTQERGA